MGGALRYRRLQKLKKHHKRSVKVNAIKSLPKKKYVAPIFYSIQEDIDELDLEVL